MSTHTITFRAGLGVLTCCTGHIHAAANVFFFFFFCLHIYFVSSTIPDSLMFFRYNSFGSEMPIGIQSN